MATKLPFALILRSEKPCLAVLGGGFRALNQHKIQIYRSCRHP